MPPGPANAGGPARLRGDPVRVRVFAASATTNRRFVGSGLERLAGLYLPSPVSALVDAPVLGEREFIEDDNRSAIDPEPVATLDGLPFFLSVKGVGSTVEPFSDRRLDRFSAAALSADIDVGQRLRGAPLDGPDRLITGELWLRGSPYGGQGLLHAETALRVSERADPTSIAGFRVAPVVHVCRFPEAAEQRLRSVYWYRSYRGPFVQELRLVPSNVRIYFHSRTTVGGSPAELFERFGIDGRERATAFQTRFLQTAVPLLTLLARTLARDRAPDRFRGLDFHDVWLDKDAVVAPDGSVYFVDLEGVDEVVVDRSAVRERIEDQIYRSLYEVMFAHERIDEEAQRRFGAAGSRRDRLVGLLREGLRSDPFVRLREGPRSAALHVVNSLGEESLNIDFPVVDA